MKLKRLSPALLASVTIVTLASTSEAALVSIPLTPEVAASSPSAHGGSLANTTTDTFLYNPLIPTSPTPITKWSAATHFHGDKDLAGAKDPTVFWALSEITWIDGSDLQFDFYGRTECCPERDNNYDIALLIGGTSGTVVAEVFGNNAPDDASNYLRTDMGATLSAGDKFDTIRIRGNNGDFTIAEVRLAADIVPEPSALALFGLAGAGLLIRRRR